MQNYVIYARFSPRPDAETSSANQRQIELCREYVKSHNGVIRHEFQDRDKSGDDPDRPGLLDAIDALQSGDILLAYTYDRLARSAYLGISIERSATRVCATIATVTGGLYDTSPEGTLIRRILFDIAEYQKTLASARTRRAMLRHQREGRRMSKETPYGTVSDNGLDDDGKLLDKSLKPCEEESTAVDLMVSMFSSGAGYGEIAQELTRRGHKPRGRRWYRGTIRRIVGRKVPDVVH